MNKIFNIVSSFKTIEKEDATIYISGMASTKDQDRAGDVIEAEAWAKGGLLNFTKNPVLKKFKNYMVKPRYFGRLPDIMLMILNLP